MSAPSPPAGGLAPPAGAPKECCPLCNAPLRPDQDWCLSCGAAARTRLAAPPRWKALAIAVAAIALLAFAVLAAALVRLTG